MEQFEAAALALVGHAFSKDELEAFRLQLERELPGPWEWLDEAWVLGPAEVGSSLENSFQARGYATLASRDETVDLLLQVSPHSIQLVFLNLSWEEFVTDGPARSEALLSGRTVARMAGVREILFFPDSQHQIAEIDEWAMREGLSFGELKSRAYERFGKPGDLGSPLADLGNYFLDTTEVTIPRPGFRPAPNDKT